MSNLIIFMVRRFATVCMAMRRAVVLIRNLPVIDMTIVVWSWIFGILALAAKETKEEREKESKKLQELEGALGRMTVTLKEISKGISKTHKDICGRCCPVAKTS